MYTELGYTQGRWNQAVSECFSPPAPIVANKQAKTLLISQFLFHFADKTFNQLNIECLSYFLAPLLYTQRSVQCNQWWQILQALQTAQSPQAGGRTAVRAWMPCVACDGNWFTAILGVSAVMTSRADLIVNACADETNDVTRGNTKYRKGPPWRPHRTTKDRKVT